MITLKLVDQGRSDFYVGLTMSICVLESKQMLIILLYSFKIRYTKSGKLYEADL